MAAPPVRKSTAGPTGGPPRHPSLDYLLQVPRFLDSLRCLENPGAALAARAGRRATLRFRSGLAFQVDPSRPTASWRVARILIWLAYCGAELVGRDPQVYEWAVDQERGIVTAPYGIAFTLDSLEPTIFVETFIADIHYDRSDLAGLVVVDAGAYVGDTALYYARRGATVHAYEPDPTNFAKLVRNLSLNAFGNRVRPFQEAVGVDGSIPFQLRADGGSQGYLPEAGKVTAVTSASLKTVVGRLPAPGYLLKADIKGAEYEIARQPAIREFEKLQIEYNGNVEGGVRRLMALLEDQGFVGTLSNPNRVRLGLSNWGLLRMERRDRRSGPPAAARPA